MKGIRCRIRATDHGIFTSLIFFTNGSLSKETTVAYKRMAEMLAAKLKREYAVTLAWMRCSFPSLYSDQPLHVRERRENTLTKEKINIWNFECHRANDVANDFPFRFLLTFYRLFFNSI